MNDLELYNKKKKNVLVKIEGALLKLPLTGVYQINGEQKITAIISDPYAIAKPVTILDVIKDINKLLPDDSQINEESLKSTIQPIIDPSKVSFELNEVFYLSIQDKEGKLIDSEYAFEISLNTEGAFDFSLFDLKKASLALWNTNREEQLDKMGISELIKLLSV